MRRGKISSLTSKEFLMKIKESSSASDFLRDVGLRAAGSNFSTLRNRIKLERIDVSHWNSASSNKNKGKTLEQVMVENSSYRRKDLKKRLIKYKIIPYSCQVCGILPFWNGKKMTLVLDHINGKHDDHRKENLRFLCPNCNSQTPTFCGRNKKKISYCECGKTKNKRSIRCCACHNSNRCKAKYPEPLVLEEEVLEKGYSRVSKELGVSPNAVKKYLKKHLKSGD